MKAYSLFQQRLRVHSNGRLDWHVGSRDTAGGQGRSNRAGSMVSAGWFGLRVIGVQSFQRLLAKMHVCAVPGCHSKSDREKQLSFYRLPLSNHHLLKRWASNIGRKALPLNNNTRVGSLHFQSGKNKGSNEVPTWKLPKTPHHMNVSKQKSPKKRVQLCVQKSSPKRKTVSVGTDLQWETRITELEARVVLLEKQLNETRARTLSIDTILQNDTKVQFYTGFPSRKHFEICFKFPGPSVSCLQYWGSQNASIKAAWEEVWTTKKAITLRGIFLNFD